MKGVALERVTRSATKEVALECSELGAQQKEMLWNMELGCNKRRCFRMWN
jgi:hypothetical protein